MSFAIIKLLLLVLFYWKKQGIAYVLKMLIQLHFCVKNVLRKLVSMKSVLNKVCISV